MRNGIAIITVFLIILSSVSNALGVPPPPDTCTGVTGMVFATREDLLRNVENFSIGEDVWITGANFADQNGPLTGKVNWTITNQSADGPVKPIIASGTADLQTAPNPYGTSFNNNPAYITPKKVWTVTAEFFGKDLRLNVWHESWPEVCKNPGKRPEYPFKVVFDTFYAIPEFPTVALPVAAVIGLLYLFQHRKRKKEKEE